MEHIRLDNLFFQRGQTWSECLESWQTDYRAFLSKVLEGKVLGKTLEKWKRLPKGSCFAVYYSEHNLVSKRALPFIGNTLERIPHISVRYFCDEYFFPVLYHRLGRKTPQILQQVEPGAFEVFWQGPLFHEMGDPGRIKTGEGHWPSADEEPWIDFLDRVLAEKW